MTMAIWSARLDQVAEHDDPLESLACEYVNPTPSTACGAPSLGVIPIPIEAIRADSEASI
jgi:hypothetical protein